MLRNILVGPKVVHHVVHGWPALSLLLPCHYQSRFANRCQSLSPSAFAGLCATGTEKFKILLPRAPTKPGESRCIGIACSDLLGERIDIVKEAGSMSFASAKAPPQHKITKPRHCKHRDLSTHSLLARWRISMEMRTTEMH